MALNLVKWRALHGSTTGARKDREEDIAWREGEQDFLCEKTIKMRSANCPPLVRARAYALTYVGLGEASGYAKRVSQQV